MKTLDKMMYWFSPTHYVFRQIETEINGTPFEECKLLFSLAKRGPEKGVVVEIGSHRGKSTIFLAMGSKIAKREKVYAVDPHVEFKGVFGGNFGPEDGVAFLENIERFGVNDWIVYLKKTSAEAVKGWNKNIRLLWIDGDHRYESVKQDFLMWSPFLSDKAYVALHDSTHEGTGPWKVVQKYLIDNPQFGAIRKLGLTTYAQKI